MFVLASYYNYYKTDLLFWFSGVGNMPRYSIGRYLSVLIDGS